MVIMEKEINKKEVLTLGDLDVGETFVILRSDYAGVYLVCDNYTFVSLISGCTFDIRDEGDLPVEKVDFILTIK